MKLKEPLTNWQKLGLLLISHIIVIDVMLLILGQPWFHP